LSPSRMFSLALRDRICRCDITALSSVVIAKRGGAVAILPSGNECADHTLHEAQFCNDMLAGTSDLPLLQIGGNLGKTAVGRLNT
jgi:hypothetical protein